MQLNSDALEREARSYSEIKPTWRDENSTVGIDPVLQFEVVSTDGGQFSEEYGCDNILRDDHLCYCTSRRERVNIILRHVGGRPFNLSAVEIAAPTEGYSSPLGQGLVFVSWDYPDVQATNRFNWVRNMSDYRQSCSQDLEKVHAANAEGGQLNETHPAAFFDLSTNRSRMCCKLDVARSGRYVLLKLLKPRLTCGENIDVQYVGLHGWMGPRAFGSASCR